MKKYTPYLLILAIGFLSLTLTTSDAMAQACQHLHQLSKKLNKQVITKVGCKLCVCEKAETFFVKHRIQASILADCDCDETNDNECDRFHAHPSSRDGDDEGWACVWSAFDDVNGGAIIPPDAANYQSSGIPDDCIFDATITRWVKYCKDNTDNADSAWPRAGYHFGNWKIRCGTERIANGSLNGVDGVDPSFERSYSSHDRNDHHGSLPGGQSNNPGIFPDGDFCDHDDCYIPGWQVGCITGTTTDLFFRNQCPPTGTYDKEEVGNIADCALGDLFVINDFRGKQICITPTATWKVKACYSGGNSINENKGPCDQWGDNWSVRLEGVIAITATGCIQ